MTDTDDRAFVGGPPESFLEGYRLHDVGEAYLVRQLQRRGHSVELTGYDNRTPGEPAAGVLSETPDRFTVYDLEANGVPIDVKCTQYSGYLGNVREYHWTEYLPELWIACFVVDGGTVVNSGAYKKMRVSVTGRNRGANGETFVEPRPVGPLCDLFHAVELAGGRHE